jgi:hypothetical protein
MAFGRSGWSLLTTWSEQLPVGCRFTRGSSVYLICSSEFARSLKRRHIKTSLVRSTFVSSVGVTNSDFNSATTTRLTVHLVPPTPSAALATFLTSNHHDTDT